MSYTGLQWAVIIEAIQFLDGVVGGGYTSGDQSEYVAFQNMIDGVYEFFTEFNDPNQTYSYDDFIAILDEWIADGKQYSDPTRPDEPQGLVGPQQGKELNINVSSTPTTPTITPSAPPMGGQIASPEGEFAKEAFARYNKGMQGKIIRWDSIRETFLRAARLVRTRESMNSFKIERGNPSRRRDHRPIMTQDPDAMLVQTQTVTVFQTG